MVLFRDMVLSKKKGVLQNPAKRFCGFLKASKCVQSLKKRIKNSTEPSKGSEEYPLAEPSLTKPFFRFCTAKKGSVEKYETLRVQYETIRVSYQRLMVLYWTLKVSYWTLKVSYFSTEPFFAVQNLKKGFVRDGSASGYSSEPFEGSVEFFILFLRLWTHLDAFRNPQNFFTGFCNTPFFFESSVSLITIK